MTLAIDEDGVRSRRDMPSMIDAIEDVLIEEHNGQVLMPPRTNVTSENRFFRLMPAYLRGSGLLGYKSFHGSMSEGVRYVIVLIRELTVKSLPSSIPHTSQRSEPALRVG